MSKHCTIPRDEFACALAYARKAMNKKSTVPILATVRLEFDGTVLEVRSTDLDTVYQRRLKATGKGRFAVCLDAATLHKAVSKSAKGTAMLIEDGGDECRVSIDGVAFTLPVLPAEDFPMDGNIASTYTFAVDVAAFSDTLRKAVHAISTEYTRYYLNGPFLERDGDELRLTGTDGHRLVTAAMPAPDGFHVPEDEFGARGLILNGAWCDLLLDLLKKHKAEIALVELGTTKASNDSDIWWARATFDDVVLAGRIIDGSFPDWRRVLPAGTRHALTVDPGELARGIDKVTVISSERGRAVRVSPGMRGEDSHVLLTVASPDRGTAETMVNAGVGSDETQAPEFGVNSDYLKRLLGLCEGRVTLRWRGDGGPIKIMDQAHPGVTMALMPLRI